MNPLKTGDLIKDMSYDNGVGLIVSEVRFYGSSGVRYVEVLWNGSHKPQRIDTSTVRRGLIRVINESR